MPVETVRDEDLGITVHRCDGALELVDVLAALKGFYESDLPDRVLWDLSGITEVRLSAEDIRTIALHPLRYRKSGTVKGGKRAFFADSDLKFGLARMVDAYKEHEDKLSSYQTRTFSERDAAIRWLRESS